MQREAVVRHGRRDRIRARARLRRRRRSDALRFATPLQRLTHLAVGVVAVVAGMIFAIIVHDRTGPLPIAPLSIALVYAFLVLKVRRPIFTVGADAAAGDEDHRVEKALRRR